jgi:hypothetical protein
VGQPFSYQITASNSPTSFDATGLPAPLTVDTGTGLISGTPSVAAVSNVSLTATNSAGTSLPATVVLTVSASPTPTPPPPTPTPTISPTPPAKLLNISTRVDVETGDNVAIGGFIIIGNGVQTPKTVVIRAIGPSLANAVPPVTGTLADPVLELHDSSGALISSNNDWMSNSAADQATIVAKGLDMFEGSPISNLESIIVATR